MLVVPLVFRAPEGPAAREIATRELRSEWSISKPARALRSLRRPSHRRRLRCCVVSTRPCCQSHFIPSRRTLIAESTFNFACNSPATISNIEFTALKLQCFQTLLNLLPIELHATFLRPGSAVTFGLCGQVLRLEVRSVSLVSSMLGCSRGLRERKIAPA